MKEETLISALEVARAAIIDMRDTMGAIRGSAVYPVRGFPGVVSVRMGKQEFAHLSDIGIAATNAINAITEAFKS